MTPLRRCSAVLAGALLLASIGSTPAARISEPNTVLYGRIVERVGEREFPITTGQLVWNIRTVGPGGRDYQLSTKLERLAGGSFSYRLSIPHEVLAYDLTVNQKAVGLATTRSQVQHRSVTLDGKLLTITPGAVDGFSLDQSLRAGAVRIDLSVVTNSTDTDGDGLPDWWEDQNGLDKYDASDALKFTQQPTQPADDAKARAATQAQTFAEWRSVWFPGSTGDLDAFGQEDQDKDGIPNILEYAFDLDPGREDSAAVGALPYGMVGDGRPGVGFRKRANATDLNYHLEVSNNLFQWQDGSNDVQEVVAPSGTPNQRAFLTRSKVDSTEQRFFRVRVSRK